MDCLFCQLIESGNILKILESPNFIAFLDIAPRTKGQTIVASKKHFDNFESLSPELLAELNLVTQVLVKNIESKLKAKGVSIIINSGAVAGQRIPHFALMIYPRYADEETKGIPTGAIFKPIETSEADLKDLMNKLRMDLNYPEKNIESQQTSQPTPEPKKDPKKEELVIESKQKRPKKKVSRKKENVEFI